MTCLPYLDLQKELLLRTEKENLRTLPKQRKLIDFASNDYLGLSQSLIFPNGPSFGSTGSRLISGNSILAEEIEKTIANFHDFEAALLFSSGYMANVGLLSAIGKRRDLILFDSCIHASIRDGIRLSSARAYSFRHNQPEDLKMRLKRLPSEQRYVCIESVYSTNGSLAPLNEITRICEQHGARLIVDEAHSVGIFGSKGEGLAPMQNVFAKIVTFGKALGGFGAAVLCSSQLKNYLINFARTAIFTTALPYPILLAIQTAYGILPHLQKERAHLQKLMDVFETESPIKAVMAKNNHHAKSLSELLANKGFNVPALLHPTVRQGKEILRISLHSFNSLGEAKQLRQAIEEYA